MFHYQVGSLEEEPAVLADHLAARGIERVAVVHDRSPVGQQYGEWFDRARTTVGIDVTARAVINPLATEATDLVARLEASKPDGLVYLGLGVAARTVALGVEALEWTVPVVANSALMFGYAQRDWRAGWEGWVYVDTVSDTNPMRAQLRELSRATAAGPVGVAGYDIGRLLGEAIARSDHLTRRGGRDGLERVKRLPVVNRERHGVRLEERQVELGVTTRVQAQVLSGLKEGEEVVAGLKPPPAAQKNAQQGMPGGLQQGPGGMPPGAGGGRSR